MDAETYEELEADEGRYPLDDMTECENCGNPVGTWVHSQAGPIKARAWTHDRPGDPRNNIYCADQPWDPSLMANRAAPASR